MAGALHVAGESGPDEGDDRAVAVGGVDAGAADLDEVVADGVEVAEVELALRVQASGYAGPVRRQQPVGGDDVPGGGLPDQQVVAVRVEGIAVQTGFGSLQPGSEFPGEHQVAQSLRRAYVFLAGGEGDLVSRFRGGGGLGGGVRGGGGSGGVVRGDGQHGHGGLRGRERSGAGPSRVRRTDPLLLPSPAGFDVTAVGSADVRRLNPRDEASAGRRLGGGLSPGREISRCRYR